MKTKRINKHSRSFTLSMYALIPKSSISFMGVLSFTFLAAQSNKDESLSSPNDFDDGGGGRGTEDDEAMGCAVLI